MYVSENQTGRDTMREKEEHFHLLTPQMSATCRSVTQCCVDPVILVPLSTWEREAYGANLLPLSAQWTLRKMDLKLNRLC